VDAIREIATDIERLYREQGARMWRAVLAYSGDPEVTSDAVAETFAQALRRGDAVRDPERWVWRTAFRIAAGMLKERSVIGPEQDIERSYELETPAMELIEALRRLSPRQRAASCFITPRGIRCGTWRPSSVRHLRPSRSTSNAVVIDSGIR
jgi:DNA-directed RNA polymerase specialized sigma24 family protein